jgi:hypothetical protein
MNDPQCPVCKAELPARYNDWLKSDRFKFICPSCKSPLQWEPHPIGRLLFLAWILLHPVGVVLLRRELINSGVCDSSWSCMVLSYSAIAVPTIWIISSVTNKYWPRTARVIRPKSTHEG